MDKSQESTKKFSLKAIIWLISIIIVIFGLLGYGLYSYLLKHQQVAKRYATLGSTNSKGSITFDSTMISESDAKIAYVVLEKVEYFSPYESNRKAFFDVDSNKVYSIHLFVGKKAIDNPFLLDTLGKSLVELKSYFPNRQYQFILATFDSTTQLERQRFVKLK
jgi:hypothetical protein